MQSSFFFKLFNKISSKLKYNFSKKQQQHQLNQHDFTLLIYKHIIDAYPFYFSNNETSLLMRFYELNLCYTNISDESKVIDTSKFPMFFLDMVLPLINRAINKTLEVEALSKNGEISFYNKLSLTFPILLSFKLYFFINLYYGALFFRAIERKKFLFVNYLNFIQLVPDVYIFIRLAQSKIFFFYCRAMTKEHLFFDIHKIKDEEVFKQWNGMVQDAIYQNEHIQNQLHKLHLKRDRYNCDYFFHVFSMYSLMLQRTPQCALVNASYLYYNSYISFMQTTHYDFTWDLNPSTWILLHQKKKKEILMMFFLQWKTKSKDVQSMYENKPKYIYRMDLIISFIYVLRYSTFSILKYNYRGLTSNNF